jgi:hypothetical protein
LQGERREQDLMSRLTDQGLVDEEEGGMLGEKKKGKQPRKLNERRKLLNYEHEHVWGKEEEAEVSIERN